MVMTIESSKNNGKINELKTRSIYGTPSSSSREIDPGSKQWEKSQKWQQRKKVIAPIDNPSKYHLRENKLNKT